MHTLNVNIKLRRYWISLRGVSPLMAFFFKTINSQFSKNLNSLLFYDFFRACLHGGGETQIGEVKWGVSPHLSGKRDQIKMRDYMNRRVTPPKRVTSPSWGAPPLCKQALNARFAICSTDLRTAKYCEFSLSNVVSFPCWSLWVFGFFPTIDFFSLYVLFSH